MLLIGQPKSATTSFMHTLAQALHTAYKNGHNRRTGDINCEGFDAIQSWHGTTVKRSFEFLGHYIKSDKIVFKEHILPTKRHLNIIENIGEPVCVLIRDAKEAVESYKRVLSVLPEVKMDYEKLEEELKMFADIYLEREQWKPEIYKVISFKNLIEDFTNILCRVILHYKRVVPNGVEKIQLAKRNYTFR